MKQFASVLILVGLLGAVPACIYIDDDDHDGPFGCVEGFGPQVVEELNMPDFSNVVLTISADLLLIQDNNEEVLVEGEANIIDELETDVSDDTWVIEFDRCVSSYDDLNITAAMPFFEDIILTSSGDITSADFLVGNDFIITNTGSGEIDLGIDAFETEAVINGSGDIEMEGVTDDLEVVVTGSGDFESFDLQVEEAFVQISGSGRVELTALDKLTVVITGSGNVFYKGQPQLDVTITGSGQVIDAN